MSRAVMNGYLCVLRLQFSGSRNLWRKFVRCRSCLNVIVDAVPQIGSAGALSPFSWEGCGGEVVGCSCAIVRNVRRASLAAEVVSLLALCQIPQLRFCCPGWVLAHR